MMLGLCPINENEPPKQEREQRNSVPEGCQVNKEGRIQEKPEGCQIDRQVKEKILEKQNPQEKQVKFASEVKERSEHPQPGGCCSCYPLTKEGVRDVIMKPEPPRTSDYYYTCNLPSRFEHPHWFNGYGCQTDKQHPLYRTTTSEYGWYPPGYCAVPHVFYPAGQTFSNHLIKTGNYRNYSLNTNLKDVNTITSNPCK